MVRLIEDGTKDDFVRALDDVFAMPDLEEFFEVGGELLLVSI